MPLSYRVVFKFKSSKKSNNGTDVNAGQIPQILYRLVSLLARETFDLSQLVFNQFTFETLTVNMRAVFSESSESSTLSCYPAALITQYSTF